MPECWLHSIKGDHGWDLSGGGIYNETIGFEKVPEISRDSLLFDCDLIGVIR